jgi:hypothetical protein
VKNINRKIEAGISQQHEILALKQIGKAEYSVHNVDILKKLVTEANIQLRLVKLPKEFRKYEDMLQTKISVENFYSHMKTAKIPEFGFKEKFGAKFYQDNESGASFALLGEGEIPPELKDKTLKEIDDLKLETIYETPMDYDGTHSVEEFKDVRDKMKHVMDGIDKKND